MSKLKKDQVQLQTQTINPLAKKLQPELKKKLDDQIQPVVKRTLTEQLQQAIKEKVGEQLQIQMRQPYAINKIADNSSKGFPKQNYVSNKKTDFIVTQEDELGTIDSQTSSDSSNLC